MGKFESNARHQSQQFPLKKNEEPQNGVMDCSPG